MLLFAAAVFFLLITPGPGVLTVAGFAAAYGARASLGYMFGIILGAQTVMIAVASGLAGVVFSVPYVRVTLLVLSTAYLLYLGARIAFAGSRIAFVEAKQPPTFWGGYLLAVINPKAYAVSATIFSGFAFWPESLMVQNALKVLITFLIAIPIHVIWLMAGAKLKSLNLAPMTMRLVNYGMASAMVGVVGLALASELRN